MKNERQGVSMGIEGLDKHKADLETQFAKREEIAKTMAFLEVLLEKHCSKYTDGKEN